ncbi:MAG TPA: hypothetical protein VF788_12495 [Pseudonocardiaceae bacterium]|jgi:hypothetical protein
MTADEALVELLGDQRTGDIHADLIEAAKQAMLRRKHNTVLGGTVIAALREAGMTYREIEQATGIPHTTAQRWALPPTTARECD